MENYCLGPMDPAQFMASFMPINSQNFEDTSDEIDFSKVYQQNNDRSMYGPFIAIVNKLCTNYEARLTGGRADAKMPPLKHNITLFSKSDAPDPLKRLDAETSFIRMQLSVELKHNAKSDPFDDLPDGGIGEPESRMGSETFNQCFQSAANQLAYQHRLFAFSLVICGNVARFIRWDREGVVVSASIDCSQRSDLVIEFLRRFNQLTDEQRGLDPTATPATPEQVEMFESAVANTEIEPLKLSVGDRDIYPRSKLEVRDPSTKVSYYIVGKALDYDLGVVGRCTRGYLALDLSTNECVFLKDTWRLDAARFEPEHVWYEKLIKAKVPHLVKFKHASNVIPPTPPHHYHGKLTLGHTTTGLEGAQRGLTHRLTYLFDPPSPLIRGYIHYRFVQGELCRSLSEFMNSKHLTLVVLHSLKACSLAFSDASLFHRDVSFGNIMIGLNGEGKLNDWDLCRHVHVDKSLEGPRTGTWQFMSTRLLINPEASHTITDDLESHFFVLMWAALHWVKHDLSGQPCIDMEFIFNEQRTGPNGFFKGGAGKVLMYGERNSELCGVKFACKPFNDLFWDLWELFADYKYDRQRAALYNTSEPVMLPQKVVDLFEAALKKPDWIDDKVPDQFPRAGSKNGSGIPLSRSDNEANHNNPNRGEKRGFGRSLGLDLEGQLAKRQKVDEN